MDNIEEILNCLLDNMEEGIHIVNDEGKTIFYNESMSRMEGLKASSVIGRKATEFLKGVEDESSTLLNALKHGEKYVDVIQHYSSNMGKDITTINTTIPVKRGSEIVAAIEISKDMTQLKELNEKLCRLQTNSGAEKKGYTFDDIIGNSKSIKKAISKANRASLSNSSVLICGETGSGKEVFAQGIHYNGIRKDKPFIPINCAAIPSSLLEAMLFGTVKGSFTGAENKKGLFEEANGGTILLDEINSMEPFLQSKLLRVLQDGYIRPVGSNSSIDIDIRVIATLNEDPEKLMQEGRLRKDFYYRLSVLRIDIPPLRERKEDIFPLVMNFVNYYNRLLGKNVNHIDNEFLESLLYYDWPGNIRELKNVIESAMNMIDNSNVLTKEYLESKPFKNSSNNIHKDSFDFMDMALEAYLDFIERNIIDKTLKSSDYNITQAASKLKMTRQNLQYKIKKYKLL